MQGQTRGEKKQIKTTKKQLAKNNFKKLPNTLNINELVKFRLCAKGDKLWKNH